MLWQYDDDDCHDNFDDHDSDKRDGDEASYVGVDTDDGEVPDRRGDHHCLHGTYQPSLKCSQNHHHHHHHHHYHYGHHHFHYDDGDGPLSSKSNVLTLIYLPPHHPNLSFLDYQLHISFYPFHIQHRFAPQWGAGLSPFEQKMLV